MSSEPQGFGIWIVGLAQVEAFFVAIVPGYYWISKARDQTEMMQRGAVVGTALLAAAILTGLRERNS